MDEFTAFKNNEKSLFEEFKRKMSLEAARAQIKKLEYDLSDVTCGLAAVKAGCADAENLLLGGVCVSAGFVKSCSAFLGPSASRKSQIIACIGYPDGGDVTEIKVKAVKRALRDGADELEVTAPIARIRDGNYQYVKRELKKLRRAAKNHALRISAECSLLTKSDIVRLCSLAADCKINSVKTQQTGGGATVADIKNAVKDRCLIKVEGVSSVAELSSAVDLGATSVGSKNAPAVARYILAAAGGQTMP